nr:shikimate kinase [Pseudenhygromyxa sp. WMMC2535]
MGAGKSSVGRALAARRGAVFIDLDQRVEAIFGRSIPALFEQGGEAYFRRLERASLRSLLAEPGFAGSRAVVATGGGVIVDPRNLDDMRALGTTIYLEVGLPALTSRLREDAERGRRPLLAPPPPDPAHSPPPLDPLAARLASLLADREQAYRGADLVIDGAAELSAVCARIEAALAEADEGRTPA